MNFVYLLLAVKGILLVWGVLGFVEYFFPSFTFGLQDKNFPAGVQFLHWFLLTLTGSVFVVGYFLKWKYTPFATIAMYATLAALCFVETVDFNAFGGGKKRYFIMTAEYIAYFLIALYLIKSVNIRNHFGNFL